MKDFVNYRKRSIQLPKGCKDLSDVLQPTKKSQSNRESRCEYCGAPAGVGWACGMWSADGTKSEESHFRCEQCQEDLKEFESRPENRMPRFSDDFDFSDPKAMEPVERLVHEIRERELAFMRQKLAERKGPDHAA